MKRKSILGLTVALALGVSALTALAGCDPGPRDYPTTDTNAPALQPDPADTTPQPGEDATDQPPGVPPAP